MPDDYQGWIDGDGRLLSLDNLLSRAPATEADHEALFERGAVALGWDDTGVRLRYVPGLVQPGALRGAIRQIRTVPRPVSLDTWTGTGWTSTRFADGSLAADELRRVAQDATSGKAPSDKAPSGPSQ